MDFYNNESFMSMEHPLLNSVILRNLFRVWKADVKTLKNIRLVCLSWFEESLVHWRAVATLCIVQKIPIENEGQIVQLDNHDDHDYTMRGGITLEEYEERLLNYDNDFLLLATVPFPKYKFNGLTMGHRAFYSTPIFWSHIKATLRCLKVENCTFLDMPQDLMKEISSNFIPTPFFKLIFEMLPNLEELLISECQFPETQTVQDSYDVRHEKLTIWDLTGKFPGFVEFRKRLPNLNCFRIGSIQMWPMQL